jgi:hypothetical protein
MTLTGTRHIVVPGLALACAIAFASVATAQVGGATGMHNAIVLAGPTAFYSPPLKNPASLKVLIARRGMAEDIRTVLRESGIPETGDAVLAVLSAGMPWVTGGSCDQATPADGVIVACDVQTGSSLQWMALRPNGRRGDRTPSRLEQVRWSGTKPFKALLFRVTNDYKTYTFVLPLECSNLSLMSFNEIKGEPVAVSVEPVCDPATGNLRATVRAAGRDLERVQRVSMSINGDAAGELTAPSWTLVTTKSGDYTFDAFDAKGRAYPVAQRSIRQESCPAPLLPEVKQVAGPVCSVVLTAVRVRNAYEINVDATGSAAGSGGGAATVSVELRNEAGTDVGQKLILDNTLVGKIVVRKPGTYRGTVTVSVAAPIVQMGSSGADDTAICEASITLEPPVRSAGVFFDVLGGKERRVRPVGNDTEIDFAQCSPLLGVKFGVAKRFKNDWELAATIGVAISLVTDDHKVKESELLIDAEVNRYLGGGSFVGTGISFWDLTRKDTFTPAWLLHFGYPLTKSERHPIYLMVEGRLFFDHIGDVSNNYQVWAGVRMHFR